ncbi:FUSC family protein [Luteimonas sp. RC10]|uniref:FUSC family protein n=1 Tax=Luteimonas sp. RC10 TaxID=2587035 RepID=UPI00179026C9|nr:putative membrane protein YccC [Luteimonas sp. RC10]
MHATPTAETSPGVPPTRLVRLRDALASGLSALDLTTPRATYVMRSLLAAGLALVVAYWLDLHAPYAAASSVLLVIHPVQGAVIGKGAWRVLGTLAGMLAAFVLMGAFGQMPWLFLLGFGLWLGLCVVGMTLLRHFRAYGATLAGYTVGLAAYGAMQHPELTFDQVIGRGASVLVGVVCLAAVSAVFSARSVHSRLAAQLHRLAAATADVLATQHQAIHGRNVPGGRPLDPGRRALILEVYGVDDLLAQGKAESADLARRAGAVRQAMVSLFSALVGGAPPMGGHGAALDALRVVQPDWERTWRQATDALSQAPGAPGLAQATRLLSGLRARVREALAAVSLEPVAEQATLTIAGDRLIEQLDDYLDALASIAHVHSARPIAGAVSVPFHRDIGAAIENGLRAMLTVVLGGAFWIVTGWTYGHMMLAGLAAACALLSTAPDPARGAIAFLQGTVAAAAMAFVCAFVVLPHISGLPLLLVVLGLFWWPGIYATTMPRHALAGVAYLVAFTSLAAVDNPMRDDIALFLNGAVAWILAVCFTLLGFRTVLPRNASRDVGRLCEHIRGDALTTLSVARADAKAWQWRQQHRIAQLGALLRAQPEAMDRAVADALASLHLGREVLRLRQWLRRTSDTVAAHRVVSVTLARMRRRADAPMLAARHARRAAAALSRTVATSAVAVVETRRLIGALLDIAALLERHAGAVPQRKRELGDVA